MSPVERSRPILEPDLSAAESQRWYWLKDELVVFARSLGIRSTGAKELLASRILAKLNGHHFVEPRAPKRTGGRQLSHPLSHATVIPVGQRCSEVVRAWMREQAGDSFHFDADMRAFFAETDGSETLQHALDHWYATRDQGERSIDPQFEYNRFMRAWHVAHPEGGRDALLAAWQEYRALPIDERGRA